MRILIAAMFLAAALGAGWAQEGDKAKEAPKAPVKKDGDKKEGGGEVVNAGFLTLDQVDTNGDGKVTRAELEAALKKLVSTRDGEKKEGDARKRPDAPKKDGEKEGDKKPAPEKKEGDK